MAAPIIGLSAERSVQNSAFGPKESIIQVFEYAEAVAAAGGRPVLLPATTRIPEGVLEGIDGLVLVGGGDLTPELYGETAGEHNYGMSPIRDAFEVELVNDAQRRGLPILAICRGMQLINVLRGGNLIQHIEGHWQEQSPNEVHHEVEIDADSELARVVGSTRIGVNSYHHQGLGRIGEGLRVVARDGESIEAVEDLDHNILAVQWHPEHLALTSPTQRALFEDVIARAERRRSQHHNQQKGVATHV
ncbi:gamma-glutamyl-gamma-aminobutyrate hydrolase family protein [Gulosibacter molinativorax]|uniref:Gamma-glutamyl-gamma-aminobutyrate hydrolase family protein n=1 Tax=Gulosibacter molinativorax TaxID=256821 RepID=A0ABT7C4A8_9MICO|nr:gamma-glutamyl-gamma-aminobutyrate hydrolase family protein [Gulosibacter molinativorax]MDJ1370040.1 gamma-glutamyl-gamma-aminobutyrate hydrolase family protein [Gulosibacter molinativorax]QUY63769.1 Putative glutamine amidotransferase-like protein yvdE [Gulosibacter molinativorax]